mmetsp:Transcript_11059/g.25317  ORF Transcript_11059/g.25317 Transcript_11059/m.25317 type:complete len:323 (+) Transcript_11059:108-1076(+)
MGNQVHLQPRCCQPCCANLCFHNEGNRHEHNEVNRKDGHIFAASNAVLSAEEITLDDHVEKELATEVELWRLETLSPTANLRLYSSTLEVPQPVGGIHSAAGMDKLKLQPYGGIAETASLLGLSGVHIPAVSSSGGIQGKDLAEDPPPLRGLQAAAPGAAAGTAAAAAAREGSSGSTGAPSGESGRSMTGVSGLSSDGGPPTEAPAKEEPPLASVPSNEGALTARGGGSVTVEDAQAVAVEDDDDRLILITAVQANPVKVATPQPLKDVKGAASPRSDSSSDGSTFAGFIEAADRDDEGKNSRTGGVRREDNVRDDRTDMIY